MLLPMTIAVAGGAVVTQGLRSPSLGHGLERLREQFDTLIVDAVKVRWRHED
jgi:hypothetical protein